MTQTVDFGPYLASWVRHLRAGARSENTIRTYVQAVRTFAAFCEWHKIPQGPTQITKEHMETFATEQVRKHTPATAESRVRHVRTFFAWLVEEGELAESPMASIKAPKVPETEVPILLIHELERIFKACAGLGFNEMRDRAIFRLLLDTGLRAGELLAMQMEDIDWELQRIKVHGKGRRERYAPLGYKSERDLDRYCRRARKGAAGPGLTNKGPVWLSADGSPIEARTLRSMIERRGVSADLEGLHPHLFRHTFAHLWLLNGGSELDLMKIAGWTNPAILARYGSSGAELRAREAHRKRSPADRLDF